MVLFGSSRGDFAAVPDSPSCPEVASYARRWLVIAATSARKEDAETVANREGWCVLPASVFSGMKPNVYAVVSGAYPSRHAAVEASKQIQKKHKGAYVKPSGRYCPPPASLAPQLAAQIAELGLQLNGDWHGDLKNRTTYWNFEGSVSDHRPSRIYAQLHQGDAVRDEFYLFGGPHLVAVQVTESSDEDHPGSDWQAPASRQYFLVGNGCYSKDQRKAGQEYVCPEACLPGTAGKLADRAKMVTNALQAKGPALESLAEKLEDWTSIDDLGRVRWQAEHDWMEGHTQ